MPTLKRLDLDEVRSLIQPAELERNGFLRTKRVSLFEGTDSDGEPAFHIYLVVADKTADDALTWERIEPTVSWVRDLVWRKTGGEIWPYVNVNREREVLAKLG